MLRTSSASRGVSLIEVVAFLTIIGVASLSSLSAYAHYLQMKNVVEQRRQALLAAEQKLDELREFIARVPLGTANDAKGNTIPMSANPLDAAFNLYGPFPAITGLQRPCCFTVANLPAIGAASVGTVTIINSETPDETQFGYAYDGTNAPRIFCVNLYGDLYKDPASNSRTGKFPAHLPSAPPFPLDLNGDGAANNSNVIANFRLLPVVITVRWMGADGDAQRIDLFSILGAEQGQH